MELNSGILKAKHARKHWRQSLDISRPDERDKDGGREASRSAGCYLDQAGPRKLLCMSGAEITPARYPLLLASYLGLYASKWRHLGLCTNRE